MALEFSTDPEYQCNSRQSPGIRFQSGEPGACVVYDNYMYIRAFANYRNIQSKVKYFCLEEAGL